MEHAASLEDSECIRMQVFTEPNEPQQNLASKLTHGLVTQVLTARSAKNAIVLPEPQQLALQPFELEILKP